MAKYTDKQALDELKRLIDEIDNVRKKPRLSPKFKAWQSETSELLERVFGRNSKQVKEFDRIPYSLAAFSNQTPDSKFDEAFQQGLQKAAISLSSAVKEVQTNGVGGKAKQENVTPVSTPSTPSPPPTPQPKVSVKQEEKVTPIKSKPVDSGSNLVLVFAAAGNELKKDVLDFLSRLGLITMTVGCKITEHDRLMVEIEKNTNAGYVLMLLDSGAANTDNEDAYGLGLIVGNMGRDRVSVLISDKMTGIQTYSGISYVPVDPAGGWKFMMIKNLKTAGFDVDANLAL